MDRGDPRFLLGSLLFMICAPAVAAPTGGPDRAPSASAVRVVRDLAYYQGPDADAAKHKLDLYLPNRGEDLSPIMLWIHGGAYALGDRSEEGDVGRRFAAEGVAVAAMGYRLSPGAWMGSGGSPDGVQHPAHIKDVARAFAWLHENAKHYHLDPHKMVVSGYSAGGHLSALLATDLRYLAAVGLSTGDLRAAIPIAGAYDLEAYYQSIRERIR